MVDEQPKPSRIHAKKMLEALTRAGILRDGEYVRRVVIDIEVGSAVVVHVERFGDERLLELTKDFEGVHIDRVESVPWLPHQRDQALAAEG